MLKTEEIFTSMQLEANLCFTVNINNPNFEIKYFVYLLDSFDSLGITRN